MSQPRVCVVGSLHFDIMVRAPYLPRVGETLIGDAWWWRPGGKGGNQAMAAVRHGAATEMVGRLGDDDLGARLRERLAAAGVGLDHVRATREGSGMSVAIEQADGDYAAVVVSGANHELDAEAVAASADAIRAAAVLVLQHEISGAANVAAARLARAAGAAVILNAAPARPLDGMDGLLDVLVVNAVEAEMLGAGIVRDLDGAGRAAGVLLRLARAAIVTAGGAGVALATVGGGSPTVGAHPVTRQASHGAGDAFVGALAARLAGGADLGTALRYANAAAALHVGTDPEGRDSIGPPDVELLAGL
ncbi:MAG: PfkB family carbohydrate kinase [Chloroflexota bacterium]